MATIKGTVSQVTPVVGGEGDPGYVRMTKLGALFTADWKYQLAAAGMVYSAHNQAALTGATLTMVTGGGNGTTMDTDQPEFIIGVDAGYYMIPIAVKVSCDVDCDADNEYGEIVAFVDRTSAPPTTNASGTLVTPTNDLDGGASFPGRCWSGSTGDITDPLAAELLDHEYFSTADNGTAASALPQRLKMDYKADTPDMVAGPCSLVVCWAGTAAVTGLCTVKVAVVPSSYFPVS